MEKPLIWPVIEESGSYDTYTIWPVSWHKTHEGAIKRAEELENTRPRPRGVYWTAPDDPMEVEE